MPGDPLQPVLGGVAPFDGTAFEVESRAEFDAHLAQRSLAGLVILGLRLDRDPPSFAGVDVRGLGHKATLERLGEIFKLHPLALEDMVNAPQRPKADAYACEQILVISRMAQLTDAGELRTEQLAILFGRSFVLTVQEEADWDVIESVRARIRAGRGTVDRSWRSRSTASVGTCRTTSRWPGCSACWNSSPSTSRWRSIAASSPDPGTRGRRSLPATRWRS